MKFSQDNRKGLQAGRKSKRRSRWDRVNQLGEPSLSKKELLAESGEERG